MGFLLHFAVPVQVYPEKVAALPSQQLQTLLQTLEFGVNATEPDAMQSALEALAALAKFHFQCKQKGKAGLPAEAGTSRISKYCFYSYEFPILNCNTRCPMYTAAV